MPDFTRETDYVGWLWCRSEAGQEGWVPESWLSRDGDAFRLIRDFDAIELTVAPGDVVKLHYSDSGFCWVTAPSGETGWVPDAVLALDA